MTAPNTEAGLATEVARRRHAALQHWARVRWIPAISLLAGALVGLVTCFVQKPADRDGDQWSFAFGMGAATFLVVALFGRLLLPKPDSRCPRCECDWNSESDSDPQTWLNWTNCPCCGLKMRDNRSDREKA